MVTVILKQHPVWQEAGDRDISVQAMQRSIFFRKEKKGKWEKERMEK